MMRPPLVKDGSEARFRIGRVVAAAMCAWLLVCVASLSTSNAAPESPKHPSTWPQAYSVEREAAAGRLTLSTPYYVVEHDLRQGGAIAKIRLTHGKAPSLLTAPLESKVLDEAGTWFSDRNDPAPAVSHRTDGLTEIVTVNSRLLDAEGRESGIGLKTVFNYHWGYLKIHKQFTAPAGGFRARGVWPVATVLAPSLSDYGYREGTTEQEGASPFSFGSCRWAKLRPNEAGDAPLKTSYVPRFMLFADAGVEGLEWFVGSNLAQWELQLGGRRGQGRCVLEPSQEPAGLALSIAPFHNPDAPLALPKAFAFDYYFGIPILEGHARKPWFHASFNRNRGEWVSAEQIQSWAESGIQTVHCHNDGDYYNDGLFWRDGAYPPYPDMDEFDKVITRSQRAGLRVATYFSNKELHSNTPEFQQHGRVWGRMDRKGNLQHNYFRDKSEFGVQMCLRSGWLDFLKLSIDRVLKNHPLDGVYYDWNVALLCCNSLHEGNSSGQPASGHWDIDELLQLMEWTRQRVGPDGLVIVHNTTTPMFTMENFANAVVANEWGYGKWSGNGPELEQLPLEWSLAGARSRGVISYGQIDSEAPKRLHRLFALEALLGGVTPWPARPESFELFSILAPIGDLESCRFADWRNAAVVLEGQRSASALYSRPGESFLLLANLQSESEAMRCVLVPQELPYPLANPRSAALVWNGTPGGESRKSQTLDARRLVGEGVRITIPGDSAVLLHVRE